MFDKNIIFSSELEGNEHTAKLEKIRCKCTN